MGWIVKCLVSLLLGCNALASYKSPMATSRSTIRIDTLKTPGQKFEGAWNFTLGGRGFSEDKDEGLASFLYLRGKFTYHLLENLKVFVEPRLEMFSSRVQTRYEDDIYRSQFRLLDGYLQYKPLEILALKAGTHSQELLNQEMIVSYRKTFPGAQEILEVPVGPIKIRAMAQQLIPTSTSLNTERSKKEKLPGFFTEHLKLSNASETDPVLWGVWAGHYRWQNIPSAMAFNSSLLGNQVLGDAAANSRMLYAFDGWFGGVEGCACMLDVFKVTGGFQRIHNTLAASNAADGQAFAVKPRLFFKEVDIEFRYWHFFVESDATVATYSSSSTAGTNRSGNEYSLITDFKNLGFQVEARMANADPINRNAVQKHLTEYYLGLETHYVAF